MLEFSFAGLSLKNEEKVKYRYMLKGLEKGWNASTSRHDVNYSNLAPGEYTFSVIACNGDGVWSTAPATFSFLIQTPFWKTPWFFITLSIFVAVLIYAFYYYRLNQALELEKLRTKISADLHDDIGSTLSSISIISEIILDEKDNSQKKEMVSEIKNNSISLMEKMDDIVWSINPKNDTLNNLLLRIKRFANAVFEAKEIDYTIDIQDNIKEITLPMEYRQHIFLIMKEAINNILKYSYCTKAAINVSYTNSILEISIADNGVGFLMADIPTGNGLLNMKDRAAAIRGRLRIDSAIKSGTRVLLNVKIK
jgi:nitrate/nitrite-specific signal transduction histidine kinase